MIRRVDLAPPADAGISCQHCGQPIVAVAIIRDGPYVRWPDWRHKVGLKRQCRVLRPAEPRKSREAVQSVEQLLAASAKDTDS